MGEKRISFATQNLQKKYYLYKFPRMRLFYTFLYVLFVVLALAPQKGSAEDVSSLACEELSNESIYEKKRLKNYQVMLPGKDGWVFRSIVSFKKSYAVSKKTRSYIAALNKGFKRAGSEFIFLFPPSRGLVHYDLLKDSDKEKYKMSQADIQKAWGSYRKSLDTLAGLGVHVVGVKDVDKSIPFYYKRDHHWSPEGARISAEAVADYIKAMPIYGELSKVEFTTKKVAEREYMGTFTKAFEKICEKELPPQTVETYVTERKVSAGDDSALFGDDSEPDVILLGTSNSSPEPNVSNFDGFLKEALSADVTNLALAGAGTDTSIIAYLNSNEFKEKPAKVVVWEVPGYYDINRMNSQVFLQAIPATYGDCVGNSVVEVKDVKINSKDMDIFGDISGKNILGESYYVRLEFSEPVMKRFKLDLPYKDYADSHTFSRSKRYPNPDGVYYILLRFDNKGPLQAVKGRFHKDMVGLNVTARICKIPE